MDEIDRKRTGFDRTVHLAWLDAALSRALAEDDVSEAMEFLWNFLEGVESGSTSGSSRGKTLTVLNRVWISVPERAMLLRQAALEAVSTASAETRLAVHWAMVVGTHPFFFDVATHVGQLIKLHGYANRSQIKRRMAEVWGDRSTVARAILRVVQSMEQWEVLRSGIEKGSMIASGRRIDVNDSLGNLLIHAVLLCTGRGMPVSNLVGHPSLFPFVVHLTARDLLRNPAFRVQRQGDQIDLVNLDNRRSVARSDELLRVSGAAR
jgi:hypothetical protein